ncbi:MAG TPA: globin [Planctomycetaceae bacterium]|nr:globin [Planctomycetaceae bacterium]
MTEPAEPSTVFDQIGADNLRRVVAAFYRQVPEDDVLGPLYPPDDLAGAEERLRDFLLFRCGGVTRYLETRGHPKLRMRHAPFVIPQPVRDRWVLLMDRAMDEVQLPASADAVLRRFLHETATFLINRSNFTKP